MKMDEMDGSMDGLMNEWMNGMDRWDE